MQSLPWQTPWPNNNSNNNPNDNFGSKFNKNTCTNMNNWLSGLDICNKSWNPLNRNVQSTIKTWPVTESWDGKIIVRIWWINQ